MSGDELFEKWLKASEDNTAQEIEQFKAENEEMLGNYAQLGWKMPDDPAGAYVSMMLFKEDVESMLWASRVAVETQSARAEEWTRKVAPWEATLDPVVVRKLRENFLAQSMIVGVTTEWLVDAKQRWERAEFSSVSQNYLTIGDVTIEKKGVPLPLVPEFDSSANVAQLGRDAMTLFRWKQGNMEGGVAAARPKINGERFVIEKSSAGTFLVGFKRVAVPRHFIPSLVEYYAGKYYVLTPMISEPLSYEVVDMGVSKRIDFLPHPWMSPREVASLPDLFTHKYDGVMVFFSGVEIRVKFDPSVEIDIEGEIWEVVEREGKLKKVRNRYGKVPISVPSALGRIRACVPARSLIQKMLLMELSVPQNLRPAMSSNHGVSSKVLFVTEYGEAIFIRQKKLGRLDLIGGVLEAGETPVDALVREIFEETRVTVLPSALHFIGQTREEGDNMSWLTHLYVAKAPPQLTKSNSELEFYVINHFSDFLHSNQGRPRQVWLASYLHYFVSTLGTFQQVLTYVQLLEGALVVKTRPGAWVQLRCQSLYVDRVTSWYLRGDNPVFESESDVAKWMTTSGFWVTDSIVQQVYQLYLKSLERSTTSSVMDVDSSSSGQVVWTGFFPVSRSDVLHCLHQIFDRGRMLTAVEFYARVKELKYPISRRKAVEWVTFMIKNGYLLESPPIDGRGRRLTLVSDS